MIEESVLRSLPAYTALTQAGRDYLMAAMNSPPARAVGRSALRNVAGAYATPKFRYLADYESAGCEKIYVFNAVVDPEVLAILSQPTQITVVSYDARGRRQRRGYTPDYLEVRHDRISLIEAKTLQDLQALIDKKPGWARREDRTWTYLPAQEEAARFGMRFEIFCPDDLPKAYRTNLQIINRLIQAGPLEVSASLIRRIKKALEARPHKLVELCAMSSQITGRVIYQEIVQGNIYGDLSRQHFDHDFVVYASMEHMLRATPQGVLPASQSVGPLHQRLLMCSERELDGAKEAQKKFDDRREKKLKRNQTDYRDLKMLKEAESEKAPRLAAFVRNFQGRGSRKKLLPAKVRDAMRMHADSYGAKDSPMVITKMYADFVVTTGLPAHQVPSRESYRKMFHEHLGPERAALLSRGKRGFHATRPRTDGALINASLAIGGLRVHIDGVYGDVRSAPDCNGEYLRPIFYPLVDEASGFVLARGLKLGRPNSMAPLMALRDCYLRHGILPAQIHSDRGSEFVNNALQGACAYFGVGYEWRPAGDPRSGGKSEMFNQQLSAFLQQLAGGTYFDKAGRSADGTKKSRRTASLSIEQIVQQADRWMFEVWNKTPVGGGSKSPEELWAQSRKIFPEATVPVVDTPMARHQTSYPLKGKDFDYVRGYRYAGDAYSSHELPTLLRRHEKPTQARLDCTDPSVIHVLTKAGAIALRSSRYQRCQGMTEGRRFEEMHEVLQNRGMAAVNQHERNMKEVVAREDANCLATLEQKGPGGANSARAETSSEESNRIDFSGVSGVPGGLERITDSSSKEAP